MPASVGRLPPHIPLSSTNWAGGGLHYLHRLRRVQQGDPKNVSLILLSQSVQSA